MNQYRFIMYYFLTITMLISPVYSEGMIILISDLPSEELEKSNTKNVRQPSESLKQNNNKEAPAVVPSQPSLDPWLCGDYNREPPVLPPQRVNPMREDYKQPALDPWLCGDYDV